MPHSNFVIAAKVKQPLLIQQATATRQFFINSGTKMSLLGCNAYDFIDSTNPLNAIPNTPCVKNNSLIAASKNENKPYLSCATLKYSFSYTPMYPIFDKLLCRKRCVDSVYRIAERSYILFIYFLFAILVLFSTNGLSI